MLDIKTSNKAYERWLRAELDCPLVAADIKKKHKKMAKNGFSFLRATYWRWAETILSDCNDINLMPEILSIGDTHLENFGTWRDVEGRLIWGVNDFDEAAVMPYALDLIRLAASAMLALQSTGKSSIGERRICALILAGYREGLANPEPVVLERSQARLRRALLLTDSERRKFWTKLDELDCASPRPRFRKALAAALPSPSLARDFRSRQAGTGSLGRPRYVVVGHWLGGPVVREAKAVVHSAWSRCHRSDDRTLHINTIAHGLGRAPDPHYHEVAGIVVRRLSPSNRKIEVEHNLAVLLSPRVLKLMGRDIGNCHAGDKRRVAAVREHVEQQEAEWLRLCAAQAVARIEADFAAFKP
jgi:hypothetical protein